MEHRITLTKATEVVMIVVAMLVGTAVWLVSPASAETASNGYPYCASSASDPDGDGWGWENNQSCVVRGSRADPGGSTTTTTTTGSSGTAPNGYPYCASSASDPDGDGWGWENNRSCVVRTGSTPTTTSSSSGSTSGCPGSCGSYTVSGLGSRKQAILNAGGDTLDLAVAMLETDNMQTNYTYGDGKSGDAANFGVFKQNWGMIRQCNSRYSGLGSGDYNRGAELNSNLGLDVQTLNLCQSKWGINTWFAGHRNGSSGLSNPNTTDIQNYRNAIYWIKAQIDANSANRTNDTRWWVQVQAI